jgi:hypothetical protein
MSTGRCVDALTGNLDFAAAFHFDAEKGRWAFSTSLDSRKNRLDLWPSIAGCGADCCSVE